ncbi:signal peptidase I [Glacieibacterium sp.]|uniref:signal peptidase I n=1 Tax=Glacieibacterium sp. TaxID=2860237 RepID=UPI003AFFB47F
MPTAQIDTAREAHQARAAAQFAQLKMALRVIVVAVVAALGLRTVAYEPFNIPSESMLPTLMGGDYLFVAKWPYGYSRFSLPLGLPLFDGRIEGQLPRRGDVVVFKSPLDNRTDFIKRVMGLPGDRVRVTGGRVEINGQLVAKTRTTDFVVPMPVGGNCDAGPSRPDFRERSPAGIVVCRYPRYTETVGTRRYEVLDQVDTGVQDNTPVITVPAGHIWVLGDNRDDSADSRLTVAEGGVGLVPTDNLVGRADRVFFSVDGSAHVSQPATLFTAIRRERIGTRL